MDTALLPDPREGGLSSELPKARLEKAVRLLSLEKRKESAGAGLLLARILPRFLASAEEVFADERGKLLHPRLFLSLAHGGGMAVLAVGERPVGCDVEKLSRVRETVLRRFSKEERAFVEAAGERAREGAFLPHLDGQRELSQKDGRGAFGVEGGARSARGAYLARGERAALPHCMEGGGGASACPLP